MRPALLVPLLLLAIPTILAAPTATQAPNPPLRSGADPIERARTPKTMNAAAAAAAAAATPVALPASPPSSRAARRRGRTLESELAQHLDAEEPGLACVLRAIARATAGVAEALRNATDDLGTDDDSDDNDDGEGERPGAAVPAPQPSGSLPRSASCGAYVGTHNAFGDAQLELDVLADQIVFDALRACPAVASASSEETPEIVTLRRAAGATGEGASTAAAAAAATAAGNGAANGACAANGSTPNSFSNCTGYSVAFDPLDGSSIVGANMAVGSIFGVWRGQTPLGQRGSDQAAAAYALFGPRTLLVLARPRSAAERAAAEASPDASEAGEVARRMVVQQFVWVEGGADESSSAGGANDAASAAPSASSPSAAVRRGEWRLSIASVRLDSGPSAILAPANLRAASSNPRYKALIDSWIESGALAGSSSSGGGGAPTKAGAGSATLRYSGGMVPDVHHVLSKKHGLFLNPTGSNGHAPAKLRLMYECAPLALVIEAAGGRSTHDGSASLLELPLLETNARTAVALGSRADIARSAEAMRPLD
jgi:sedoheptulose-bisphosphatase